jgi:hypothetical protein
MTLVPDDGKDNPFLFNFEQGLPIFQHFDPKVLSEVPMFP